MFDWNEDEEVRDTIWGVLNETEDHIVPYPKESEGDSPPALTEYSKKQRHEQTSANLIISDQGKSDSKNDFPGSSSLEGSSDFDTHEELSASRFDMDSWPDLPSLNSAFSKGFIERNHLHPMSSKFISDCTRSTPMVTAPENIVTELYDADAAIAESKDASLKDSCSLPVDSEPGMFINGHEHKESDSFLDCDWGNIADFDDFDRIFRNDDSLFGHEMISHADEILSPSADGDDSVAPSFPVPDMRGRKNSSSEGDSSVSPADEQPAPGGAPKSLEGDDVAENNVAPGEQAMGPSQLVIDNCGKRDHSSDKTDRLKKSSKARRRTEEKIRTSSPQNLSGIQQFEGAKMAGPLKSPSQSIFHGEDGGSSYMGVFPAAGKFFRPSFEYPIHAFPAVPVLSAAPPVRKQSQPAGESPRAYQASSKLGMTPQEKIEKLRRRQQMQAMLAIQQQQQQLEQKSTSTEMSATQISSQQNQSLAATDEAVKLISSSELSLPPEGEELHNSVLIDDSLGETIFYQLRDAIGKLDMGVRLCIRDSLFRLAKSAVERHNAGDRSSTNKSSRDEEEEAPISEEPGSRERSMTKKLPPSETGTNPIDRIVAHLLFHWPSPEPGARPPVKDETPPSPLPSFPASKKQTNPPCEDISDGKPEREEDPSQTLETGA